MVDTGRFLWVIFLSCLIAEVALFYLDLTVNWWRWSDSSAIRRLFNTTREDALASWFSVSQTLIVAFVAWGIFAVVYRRSAALERRLGWLIIAAFFTYMCVDDGAEIHERLGTAFGESKGTREYPSYAWQFLLLPFFALMGAFVLYFLWWEMPRMVDRVKVAAGIGCFVLAVGMDFVEGLDNGYQWLIQSLHWDAKTIVHFSKSLEEIVEMVGMSIFLVTFLGHLARTAPRLTIDFEHESSLK